MSRDYITDKIMRAARSSRMKRRLSLSPHIDARKFGKAAETPAEGNNTKKSVRFSDEIDHRLCSLPPPLALVSRSEMWYTKSEYQKMRNRETKLIKQLAKSFPNSKFAVDGVESVEYRRQKVERVLKARECVLKLQTLPQDAFASICANSTKISAQLAREKGESNASEILALYAEEKSTVGVTKDRVLSGKSSSNGASE
jgi:ribosome-associated translation inhibitor RaiA